MILKIEAKLGDSHFTNVRVIGKISADLIRTYPPVADVLIKLDKNGRIYYTVNPADVNYRVEAEMGISTKSTYGIRAMLELALHHTRGPISVAYISEREDISMPYLEQLLSRLRRKGLVKSIRGPKGGYILAKKPRDITVGNIVRALDGEITPVHCVGNKLLNRNCKMIDRCVTKSVWKSLKDTIDNLLGSVTLRDLCNDARRMGLDKAIEHKYMFHI